MTSIQQNIRQWGKSLGVRTRDLLIGRGLRPSRTDYTRFVIVCRGRSGSNLLRSYLNNHPGIFAFGEIFRRHGEIGWNMPGYTQRTRQVELIDRDPTTFLEQELFRAYPRATTAVGFKIFHWHARDAAWSRVWTHLRDMPGLRVIHLRRENLLEMYVSLIKAQKTRTWSDHGGSRSTGDTGQRFVIDIDDLRQTFERTTQMAQEAQAFLASTNQIELTYENLASNPARELSRIQSHLGVDPFTLETGLRKQNRRPMHEQILNYAELQKAFANSRWQHLFP